MMDDSTWNANTALRADPPAKAASREAGAQGTGATGAGAQIGDQSMAFTARRATLDEIFQVRWDVLRPNRPRERAQFPGDDDPRTIHTGAFDTETGRNIACATLTRVDWLGKPAWQLRGMGVVKAYQGKGVGQRLLSTLEELARGASEIPLLWCNGRKEALGFYEKLGWVVASEEFVVEDVGPHFKMTRKL